MTLSQKMNFKRACLFPFLVYVVYGFLLKYSIAILIIIGFYYLVRFKNRKKINKWFELLFKKIINYYLLSNY